VEFDRQTVASAAGGDEGAFLLLWSAYRDAVHRFACWMLQDTAAADDVVQECFMALLEHPARFDPARASLRTFLMGIARNQCRIRWRKSAGEIELEETDTAYDPRTLDGLAAEEANAILNAAVGNLPPLQREALFLFEYEGLDLDAAARIARVGVGTFKARLHRGRQRLKRELAWMVQEESRNGA
jgi:RNA polymerase sigma-70 factor (ECF subfamily)